MLIICTHPAFSASVVTTCSTITEESICIERMLCKWDNGECVQSTTTSLEFITFNAHGGSGTMLTQNFTPGTTVKLYKNNFERTGYTFKYWTTTEEDSDGTAYGDEATVSLVSSITLYAQWAPKESTITWDLNGGEPNNWDKCEQALQKDPSFTITKTPGNFSRQPATYSVTITAKYDKYLQNIPRDCKLYNAGYTFNGIGIPAGIVGVTPVYYYDKNYAGTKQWDRTEDTTLKAFWEPNVIPVTLNPGNYTSFVQEVSPKKIELKYGTGWYTEDTSSSPVLPPITNITKIPIVGGKLFNGFYYNDTQNDKITQMIDNAGEFTESMTATSFESGEYTFNAQYTDCECSKSTGVSSTTPTGTTTKNQCICSVQCSRGYSQDGGKNTTTTFSHTGTAGSSSVEVTCLPREYTITYNIGAGNNVPDPQPVKFGETLPPVASPTRDGYTFTGFYDNDGRQYYKANGTPVSGRLWDKTSDTTLYAEWNAIMYKVALNNQGATSSGTTAFFYKYDTDDGKCKFYLDDQLTQCVTANSTLISKPTKTGYTFQGYYTGENGSGTQYINSNGVIDDDLLMVIPNTGTGQLTLYAKWEPIQIEITLNPEKVTLNGRTGVYVYAQNPVPVKIRVTYGTDGFQKQDTEDAEWTTMEKTPKQVYQLTKLPIVSKQIFGGYMNIKSVMPETLINNRGVFTNNFTSTTFESDDDAEQNFVPAFTPCECSASTGVSSVEVTGTTNQNQCTCRVNCQEGYSKDSGDNTTTDFEYTGTAGVAKVEVTCNPRNYTVTYSCGDGATGTPPNDSTATYNSNFAPASNTTCTKTGYVFAGWTTTDNAENSVEHTAGTEFTWQYTSDKTFTAKWMQCDAGCYCSGQITVNANNEICTQRCPDNFTSDAGASAITDCYLKSDITFTDNYRTTIKVGDTKYYWYKDNPTPTQTSE